MKYFFHKTILTNITYQTESISPLPRIATTSSSWMTSSEPDTMKHRLSILSPVWYKRSPGALKYRKSNDLIWCESESKWNPRYVLAESACSTQCVLAESACSTNPNFPWTVLGKVVKFTIFPFQAKLKIIGDKKFRWIQIPIFFLPVWHGKMHCQGSQTSITSQSKRRMFIENLQKFNI